LRNHIINLRQYMTCYSQLSEKNSKPMLQPKLKIGEPGDRYEREADAVADRVMRMREGESLRMQPMKEEEERVLMQPLEAKAETMQPRLRMQPEIRRQCPACREEEALQRQSGDQAEKRSPVIQRSGDGGLYADASFSDRLQSRSGLGSPLPESVSREMGGRFGTDFRDVRVHTDSQAIQMNQDIGARAFTFGSDLFFSQGNYDPSAASGRHLLAHELTHVVQQRASVSDTEQRIHRSIVSDTRSNIPQYEITDNGGGLHQEQTHQTIAGVNLQLVYDPSIQRFTVTMPLIWVMPHAWDMKKRQEYVNQFRESVRRVWNDKYLLQQKGKNISAHVEIELNSHILTVEQTKSEADKKSALLSLPDARRWMMNVNNYAVRESVDMATRSVTLGTTSMVRNTKTAAQLRNEAGFSYSGSGGNGTFTQAAAPHEFGHMIGLGDEYIEDVAGKSVPGAARGHINSRIMNAGENVTTDAYAPFALWLRDMTKSPWVVGARSS
jgi:hypothetical protein